MVRRRLPILLAIVLVSLGGAACTPGMQDTAAEPGAVSTAASTPTPAGPAADADAAAPLTETAALSETGSGNETPGQTEPGAATSDGGTPVEGEPPDRPVQPAATAVYTDSTYGFSIAYPDTFVFGPQPAEKQAQLEPAPAAAWGWMNPETAASDVVELEPADLELRVYAAGESASLESWLAANGRLPAEENAPLQPFQAANASGVELCASTLIAPGCAYYVTGGGWVYELIPATVEGETMAHSFRLLP